VKEYKRMIEDNVRAYLAREMFRVTDKMLQLGSFSSPIGDKVLKKMTKKKLRKEIRRLERIVYVQHKPPVDDKGNNLTIKRYSRLKLPSDETKEE